MLISLIGNFREERAGLTKEHSGAVSIFPKTIILISMDTLRADHLNLYGHNRKTAPCLDRLAEDSITFATAAAQATQTLVSHKSLFSGKYPLRLIHETTNADMKFLGTKKKPTAYLTNSLRKADNSELVLKLLRKGYKTAAFVDGGWMGKLWGFKKGFTKFKSSGDGFEKIIPMAIGWIEENATDPIFLFIHSYDIHCPYPCREPFNSRYCTDHSMHMDLREKCPKTDLRGARLTEADYSAVKDHYDSGISSADAYLGEVIDKLVELGLYDEALIVVTSDHGESLGESGRLGHGGLYLEQILVPLIIKLPVSLGIESGLNNEPVELTDVMPTILDICGLPSPPDLDGNSLLKIMQGNSKGREYLVVQTTYNEWEDGETRMTKRALLVPGQWFLVEDKNTPSTELYDLQADPECLYDVYSQHKRKAGELLSLLTVHDPGVSPDQVIEPQESEIPEELRQQLESIGYITDW